MRIFKGTAQLNVRPLGACPNFNMLKAKTLLLDLQSDATITNEKVFAGTHRLTATNKFAPKDQKHSSSARSDELFSIVKTQVSYLQQIYPGTIPVLIQCATIPPNTELLWHVDSYLYQNVSHKIHIPISTTPLAMYQCKDTMNMFRSYHFNEGHMFEINNILLHRAVNHGSTPRTHIIIDMMDAVELKRFEEADIDYFFTHHTENKAKEKNET